MRISIIALFCVFLGFIDAFTATDAISTITEDAKIGRISQIQRIEYSFLHYFNQSSLPIQYQGLPSPTPAPRSLTPVVARVWQHLGSMSPNTRALYEKMGQIPGGVTFHNSPEGHFAIAYYDSGTHAVANSDTNGNNVPDYVDIVAAAYDSVWIKEVSQLGFPEPKKFTDPRVSNSRYIVLVDNSLGSDAYAYTYPGGGGSYINMRKDFDGFTTKNWDTTGVWVSPGNDYTTHQDWAVQVTAAHEYFHAVTVFTHDHSPDFTTRISWIEGTPVLFEEIVFPHINDYFQYLKDYFYQTHVPLNLRRGAYWNHEYATCIWPKFMVERFDENIILPIWDRIGYQDMPVYDAIAEVLDSTGSGLTEAFQEFNTWAYFTHTRADSQSYFEESRQYPPLHYHDSLSVLDTFTIVSDTVDSMASKWFHMRADDARSRTFDFNGEGSGWAATLIAYDTAGGNAPVIIKIPLGSSGEGFGEIENWDQYTDVVLAAINSNPIASQTFVCTVSQPTYDTIFFAASEPERIDRMRGDVSINLTLSESASTVLKFVFRTTNPYDDSTFVSFGKFYDLDFQPSINPIITSFRMQVKYDSTDEARIKGKGVRLDELFYYIWNDTLSIWEKQNKAVVNRSDSTLSMSGSKVGLIGIFYDRETVVSLRMYPSPADFRKYSRVYFPLQEGKDLFIYTIDGFRVRQLNSANSGEYDVNRFIWDGKNAKGGNVRSGVYFYSASDSTNTHRGKMLVIR